MRRPLLIILPLLLAVLFAGTAFAQSVTLGWNANTESNIAGYKVYYRTGSTSTSYNGTEADQGPSPIDVGLNTSVTLTGLDGTQAHTFVVTAYNTSGQESTYSTPVSSAASVVNQAPVFSSLSAQTVDENSPLTFAVNASDPDGDSLTYSASGLPSGAVFDAATHTFSWIPSYSQAGSYQVTFTVSDGQLSASETVGITVVNVDRAPVLAAISPQSVAENSALTFTVSASDPDGDSLTYSASGLPQGASFDAATHTFSWTPSYSQSGNYQVTFSVSDGTLSASETVGIGVTNVDRAPVLAAIGAQTVAENAALSFTVSASDPDGDSLTYSASGLPQGASFDAATHTFSWTPSYSQAGSYQVTFSVSDGTLSASQSVGITVTNVDRAPVLAAISPQTVAENAALTFTVSASDPDGDSLTYSAGGLPQGASFDAATHTFSWTPSYSQAGSYQVTFSVSDGTLSASQSVGITVTNVDRAPVLASIGAQTVAENAALSFTVSASDPDGDSLTYSAGGLPQGASFDAATHTFSWTPSYSQAGSYQVTFSVSDGTLSASQSVAITVTNVDQAPTISGTPSLSVTVGTGYLFTPTAQDPDSGAQLSFSIANKPSWASFDTATGTLQGTPTSADVGTSSPITISVSDGTLSAALAPFTISVQAADNTTSSSNTNTSSSSTSTQYTISASSTDGGTISSSGDTTLSSGGSQVYTVTPQAGYYLSDLVVDGQSEGPLTSYTFDAVSTDHTIQAVFISIPDGLSEPPTATGLPGVKRQDGGNAADNLVKGLPKANVIYTFQVTLRVQSGSPPAKVLLVLDGYSYPMTLSSGTLDTGATYSYSTVLGPAASHSFYFETADDQGTLLSAYPDQGELAGPQVQLLNGGNLVGVPGASAQNQVGSDLGTSLTYAWQSAGLTGAANNGSYVAIDPTTPTVSGDGYFIKRSTAATLPAKATSTTPPATVTVPLQPGWNLISDPYGGNVPLSSVLVQKGTDAPVTWQQAAADNWVINALYSYNGSDWGGTYSFAAAGGQPNAVLVPWIGYWLYLNRSDASYALVIPQPTR